MTETRSNIELILATITDGIVVVDQRGIVLYANQSAERIFDRENLPGRDLGIPLSLSASYQDINLIRRSGVGWAELRSSPITWEGLPAYVISMHDITERKRAEQLIHDEKTFSDTLIASLPDIFFLLDHQGSLLKWNDKFTELFGLSNEDMLGANALTLVLEKDRPHVAQVIQQVFATGSASTEACLVMKNGLRDYLLTGDRIETQLGVNLIGLGLDITERKRAIEELITSRDLLKNVVDNAPMRIFWKDTALRFLGCNAAFAHDAGMTHPEDVVGKDDFQMGWREQAELYRADDKRVMDSDTPTIGYEEPQTTPDGRTIWLRTSKVPLHDGDGKVIGMIGIYDDITERKQSEESLRRANRALKTLSAANLALVRAKSEDELLRMVTSVIVEQGGYLLAAVGYAEDNPEKSIAPMAWAGIQGSSYWAEHISWADTERGQLPVSKTIRSGTTQICRGISSAPGFAPWKEAALALGFVSNIAMPLFGSGRTFGGLSIYSSEADAFDEEEVRLLEELANDLAYGIITLRARTEQEQHATILRQSLEQSIQTIADTVEARDLYTAGHQRRVSELATAIAREMGLPEEQVNGIHLAAIIHDLGKIRIPAEILSKPGKISAVELMLIKTHPQIAYDILKNVKFPWPIADIVLQHHEKLDGSGYPQGLKGDQILLESRIMTVADVVEAMFSHRPYRPGFGIEVALNEIKRGRGSAYDSIVTDACLKLFDENKFSFSNPS